MQSFTNLGYTVGGTVSPGCGLERFGYANPNQNQNTAFPSQYHNNDSARTAGILGPNQSIEIQHQNQNQPINQNKTSWSGSSPGWNGWQYNNTGAGTGIINTQNQNQMQMQIQTPQTVGPPNMSRNVINGSQMSGPRDWRNLTGQNMNFNYQPVTTTGASSFMIPESYQPSPNQQNLKQNQNRSQVQALSPQQQMQMQAAHNAAVSVPYFDGGNNTGLGLSNNHCQGDVCPMIPSPDPNVNIIAQNSFREVKPLNCHVKIGSPDETPVIYSNSCYENPNQDQGGKGNVNVNGGRHALEQPQQNFQRPGPGQYQGQQQIFQGQQQQQPTQQAQMQYENQMAFPVQMPQYQGSIIGNQPYSNNSMSQMPMPLNNIASSASAPVQVQNGNTRKSHTPCGQCTACKYCSGDGSTNRTRNPGTALLVRGPRPNVPGAAGGRTPDQKTEVSPSPLINIESNPVTTKAAGILSSASVPVTNLAAAVRPQPLKFGQHNRK